MSIPVRKLYNEESAGKAGWAGIKSGSRGHGRVPGGSGRVPGGSRVGPGRASQG